MQLNNGDNLEEEVLTEAELIKRNAEIQEDQLQNHEVFPKTGSKGMTNTDKIFTTAIKKDQSKLRSHFGHSHKSSKQSSPKPIEQPNLKCKGSLKQAFLEKQPWSYKVDIFNNQEQRQAVDLNFINSMDKVDDRRKIINRTIDTQPPFKHSDKPGYLDTLHMSNNKTIDKFNQTPEKLEGKTVLGGSSVEDALTQFDSKKRTLTEHTPFEKKQLPPQMTNFKNFYKLQMQKLELQKQNLIKLQKIHTEKSKMKFSGGGSTRRTATQEPSLKLEDIAKLKSQCEQLKTFNDTALADLKKKESLVKKGGTFQSGIQNICEDQFYFKTIQDEQKKPKPISSQFSPKEVSYKTGFEFFDSRNIERFKYETKPVDYFKNQPKYSPQLFDSIHKTVKNQDRQRPELKVMEMNLGLSSLHDSFQTGDDSSLQQQISKAYPLTTVKQPTNENDSKMMTPIVAPQMPATADGSVTGGDFSPGSGLHSIGGTQQQTTQQNFGFGMETQRTVQNQDKSESPIRQQDQSSQQIKILPSIDDPAQYSARLEHPPLSLLKQKDILADVPKSTKNERQWHLKMQQKMYEQINSPERTVTLKSTKREDKANKSPPISKITSEVRISSNAEDTDIQIIMKKLMINRIAHLNFDPILGEVSTRNYIKGLVFQDSELAPYFKYVHPPEMGELIQKTLKNQPVKHTKSSSLAVSKSKDSITEDSASGKKKRKKKLEKRAASLLPYNQGATVKDFQRAKWILTELNKPPYFGQIGDATDKKGQEEYDATDPEIIREKKFAMEKFKEQELFEDKVVQIFDPLGPYTKEIQRKSDSRSGRIWDIQNSHRDRVLKKRRFQEIRMNSLIFKEDSYETDELPKQLAKQILNNSYNYKKDKFVMDKMQKAVHKFTKVGGPIPKRIMDQYPGDEQFIEYLKKKYNLNWQTGESDNKQLLKQFEKYMQKSSPKLATVSARKSSQSPHLDTKGTNQSVRSPRHASAMEQRRRSSDGDKATGSDLEFAPKGGSGSHKKSQDLSRRTSIQRWKDSHLQQLPAFLTDLQQPDQSGTIPTGGEPKFTLQQESQVTYDKTQTSLNIADQDVSPAMKALLLKQEDKPSADNSADVSLLEKAVPAEEKQIESQIDPNAVQTNFNTKTGETPSRAYQYSEFDHTGKQSGENTSFWPDSKYKKPRHQRNVTLAPNQLNILGQRSPFAMRQAVFSEYDYKGSGSIEPDQKTQMQKPQRLIGDFTVRSQQDMAEPPPIVVPMFDPNDRTALNRFRILQHISQARLQMMSMQSGDRRAPYTGRNLNMMRPFHMQPKEEQADSVTTMIRQEKFNKISFNQRLKENKRKALKSKQVQRNMEYFQFDKPQNPRMGSVEDVSKMDNDSAPIDINSQMVAARVGDQHGLHIFNQTSAPDERNEATILKLPLGQNSSKKISNAQFISMQEAGVVHPPQPPPPLPQSSPMATEDIYIKPKKPSLNRRLRRIKKLLHTDSRMYSQERTKYTLQKNWKRERNKTIAFKEEMVQSLMESDWYKNVARRNQAAKLARSLDQSLNSDLEDSFESLASPAKSLFTTSSGHNKVTLPILVKSKLTKIIDSVPNIQRPRRDGTSRALLGTMS